MHMQLQGLEDGIKAVTWDVPNKTRPLGGRIKALESNNADNRRPSNNNKALTPAPEFSANRLISARSAYRLSNATDVERKHYQPTLETPMA